MYRAIALAVAAQLALITPLVSSAALPPPPGPHPNFYLKTVVAEGGDKKFDDLLVASFHTGAGEAAAATTNDKSDAAIFYLYKGTYLNQNISAGEHPNPQQVPYSFGLDPTSPSQSTAPDSYDSVSINGGENTPNFYLSKLKSSDAAFVHVKKTKTIPFETFTVCDVDGIRPYENVGPQKQLLWRGTTTPPVYNGCADVRLKTVPLH